MKKTAFLLLLAAVAFAAPACQQSYTEKAEEANVDARDQDQDETGKSVHDQADGGMGENENQTETTEADNK
jgi:hypothetical protein